MREKRNGQQEQETYMMLIQKGEVMTTEQRMECEEIILRVGLRAGTAVMGKKDLTSSGETLVLPIHVSMAVSLGNEFGISLTQSAAQGICESMSRLAVKSPMFPYERSPWDNVRDMAQSTERLGWILAGKFDAECWKDHHKKVQSA